MQKRKSQTGFTFIELVITVVVLLIVIAVGYAEPVSVDR